MGGHAAAGPERYGLSWAGKGDALKVLRQLTTATLLPAPSESVDWDTTGNTIIEGDNLEVLKVLQHAYHGKVKLIYIDPPYNTGGDFIYPDDYAEGLASYQLFTKQVNEEGAPLTTNKEKGGRYHSRWLTMIYPRLFLARNLLRDDGVIFVSIDDHEVHNLRLVMDEIFGEENFVAQMIWEGAGKNDARQIGTNHEYVLVYVRDRSAQPHEWSLAKTGVAPILKEADRLKVEHGEDYKAASEALAAWYRANKSGPSFANRRFRNIDANGVYKEDDPTAPGGRRFDLIHPRTKQVIRLRPNRGWGFDQAEFDRLVKAGRISFVTETSIMVRRYLHETDSLTPQSVFYQPARSASERLADLLGPGLFDFPKDEVVIRQFIEMATSAADADAIVLDFFAGSGTTAHAVLDLNKEDGGNRKFILVQLPEPTGRADFPTIAEITKERVRRVIARMDKEDAGKLALDGGTAPDRGFKVFKLAPSNFAVWDPALAAADPAKLAEQWQLSADNVRADAQEQALLHELMLKCGLPLASPVDAADAAGTPVFRLDGGKLLVCLARELSRDALRAMIALKPQSVLCLDIGFKGNDALKVNAQLEFQSHAIQFRTA
jgi:adenine-specific DNA-methyltransferase